MEQEPWFSISQSNPWVLVPCNRQEKFKHWTEEEQQKNDRCEILAASTKLS